MSDYPKTEMCQHCGKPYEAGGDSNWHNHCLCFDCAIIARARYHAAIEDEEREHRDRLELGLYSQAELEGKTGEDYL